MTWVKLDSPHAETCQDVSADPTGQAAEALARLRDDQAGSTRVTVRQSAAWTGVSRTPEGVISAGPPATCGRERRPTVHTSRGDLRSEPGHAGGVELGRIPPVG
jgi:hypothetical protein